MQPTPLRIHRAAATLLWLLALAAQAVAQGYEVSETTDQVVTRPASAVPVDFGPAGERTAAQRLEFPFVFRYFGEAQSSALVSPRGWLLPNARWSFPSGIEPGGEGGTFPFREGSDGILAPLRREPAQDAPRVWTWTEGSAPERRFVVSWESGPEPATAQDVTQAHLHEGVGRIVFAYRRAAVTGSDAPGATLCGLDEPLGARFVAPTTGARASPPTDLVFDPRVPLFSPPGIAKQAEPVRWQRVRKESLIPDGGTRRCTYLARGRGYFHVPDRTIFYVDPAHGRRKHPPAKLEALLAEDRATFGGKRGDPARWMRQVLDGKILLLPVDGGAPVRVWFRIVEYFTIDESGTTGADFHTWNIRRMLSNAFDAEDPREKIDHYQAWRAMARGRLSVGKLFPATRADASGKQYSSGRGREYILWSGRIRAGTRGSIATYGAAPPTWRPFALEEEDERAVHRIDRGDLRFLADPNYVDGHYDYVIEADDNPDGWVYGRDLPALPLRAEGIDVDPGRASGPQTPR